jgi:hypothetical protein
MKAIDVMADDPCAMGASFQGVGAGGGSIVQDCPKPARVVTEKAIEDDKGKDGG